MSRNLKNTNLGNYNFLSMTNIDLMMNKKQESIISTAVHEFVHSYLTKGTAYGSFVQEMRARNKINNDYKMQIKKENKNFIKNHDKKDTIFSILSENMLRVQEYAATLTEALFIKYKYGTEALNNYKQTFHTSTKDRNIYSRCMKRYGYILEDDFLSAFYEFIFSSDFELSESYRAALEQKERGQAQLDLMVANILNIAENAMNIDLTDIDPSNWASKGNIKKYIHQNCQELDPSVRFCHSLEYILPRNKKFTMQYPEDFYVIQNSQNYMQASSEYLNKTLYTSPKDSLQENIQYNIVNEIYYAEGIKILHTDQLEKVALYTAMPAILGVNSTIKLFGKKKLTFGILTVEPMELKEIMAHLDILHIHPATGIKKGKFTYKIGFHAFSNKYLADIKNAELYDVIYFNDRVDDFSSLKKIISNFSSHIYLSGCPRSEHIIDWMRESGNTNHIFLFTATSLRYSIAFINKYFNGEDAVIWQSQFRSFLLIIENEYMTLVQELPIDMSDMIKEDEDIKITNIKVITETEYRQYNDHTDIINGILKENYADMTQSKTYAGSN